jgi:hypothetical protein
MKKKSVSFSLILLVLAFLSALLVFACKEKADTSGQAEEITLRSLEAVFGKAGPQASGIAELRNEGGRVVIHYHLYLLDSQDFDELIGQDLAPKIERLYRTVPSLDKAKFEVETPDLSETGVFRPYCDFDMTRRIYQQLDWTNLLARDLFKLCKVNYNR